MNIVYALINLDKKEKPFVYIGSKSECNLASINGCVQMIGSTGKVYLGSSRHPDMQSDIMKGNRFTVEVLEVCKRSVLRYREDEWLREMDVMDNPTYYNLSCSALKCDINPDRVVNDRGELWRQLAASRSSKGKRDSTAKSLGFEDSHGLLTYICKEFKDGKTSPQISKALGKQRHFAHITTRNLDKEKFLSEDPNMYSEVCVGLWFKNYSFEAMADHLGIEVPTAIKAFSLASKRRNSVAMRLGTTVVDLDRKIALMVLKGKNFSQISRKLRVDTRTVQKYFIRFFRGRFKISDLE